MRYRRTYRSGRERRGTSSLGAYGFIMPFLIIICVGIIGVLGLNLYKMIFGEDQSAAAYLHFVEGSAQMKVWGTDSFFTLDSDTHIKSGDQVMASADARIIIEFFDGTIMRMDGGTDVVFQEISDTSSAPAIDILLVDGKLWFNKVYKKTGETAVTVVMDNAIVRSDAESNFEVENDFEEAMRVIHGDEVELVVVSEDDKEVANENVGVGQELVLTDEALQVYWDFGSPNVLTGISDIFKRSEWYLWNFEEDKSPTQFKKVGPGSSGFQEVDPELLEEDSELVDPEEESVDAGLEEESDGLDSENNAEEEVTTEEEEASPVVSVGLPTINSVSGVTQKNENGFYVISYHVGTLQGVVPEGTQKVLVNDYQLQQFKPGDTSWTYYANADYGLMKEGENVFNVVAVDADGNKSQALVVKVFYQKPAAVAQPVVESTPEPSNEPEPASADDSGAENTDAGLGEEPSEPVA